MVTESMSDWPLTCQLCGKQIPDMIGGYCFACRDIIRNGKVKEFLEAKQKEGEADNGKE